MIPPYAEGTGAKIRGTDLLPRELSVAMESIKRDVTDMHPSKAEVFVGNDGVKRLQSILGFFAQVSRTTFLEFEMHVHVSFSDPQSLCMESGSCPAGCAGCGSSPEKDYLVRLGAV